MPEFVIRHALTAGTDWWGVSVYGTRRYQWSFRVYENGHFSKIEFSPKPAAKNVELFETKVKEFVRSCRRQERKARNRSLFAGYA